ncbi:Ap4A phosphorylase-like protein II [Dendryphion nanum]|uniref:Ap4A phosphorylase-like protein II n=1 Tax=Dendryphion nanum TaxID=256645 RepID=A0A9P9DYK5_9PLEO|nr:Ap4A phosphorylase-like protein II [Dendryphion nanum]
MDLGLLEPLSVLVDTKFKSAKSSRSLIFSPTDVAIIKTSAGIPFQLRYCPSLAKKPVSSNESATTSVPRKKVDVFENPSSDLHIADIPTTNPSHLLVLNKFPIIASHFIIATKSNKQQTHSLEQDDLSTTYACLKAWQAEDTHKRLFAFFNSGEHSGASQPHRHLQFLPVENTKADLSSTSWDLLLDFILDGSEKTSSGLLQHPAVPFVHYAARLPAEPTPAQLLRIYDELYLSAKRAVDDADLDNFQLHPTDDGSLPISYNLAMTTDVMAIMPRRSEGGTLQLDDGTEIGFIMLNGTTLGGTLMVKYEEEWNVLREQPTKLDDILTSIGFPRATKKVKL